MELKTCDEEDLPYVGLVAPNGTELWYTDLSSLTDDTLESGAMTYTH